MKIEYRKDIHQKDIETVREIAASTGFFREDEINVAAELVSEALHKGQEESGYYFVFAMDGNKNVGFACFGPTPCTIGTFDLYWIVVHNDYRRHGIGKMLLQNIEKELLRRKTRKLYIETSNTTRYRPTRDFYISAGYSEEARLKDFYDQGDDKVIFAKYIYES
jgi:ribosomal protein S18 acetylase RimI-like enzyme